MNGIQSLYLYDYLLAALVFYRLEIGLFCATPFILYTAYKMANFRKSKNGAS